MTQRMTDSRTEHCGRAARLARGLAALAALTALLGGVPVALVVFIGWPLPHTLPTGSQLTAALTGPGIPDQLLIKALAVLLWIAWAALAAAVTGEVAAASGRTAPRLRLAGPLQPLAARLVTAVALAVTALAGEAAPAAHASLAAALPARPAAPAVHATNAVAASATDPTAAAEPTGSAHSFVPALVDAVPPGTPAPKGESRSYLVRRRDTLWGIAETQLGDPLRWSQIYALNHSRTMPDGHIFDDPNLLRPGWTLLLPDPDGAPTTPTTSSPPAPTPTLPTPSPATTVPTTPVPTPPVPPPPTSPTSPDPTPPPQHVGTPRSAGQDTKVSADAVELPSGSLVAGSFAAGLATALALGRLRRRHGYRPHPPQPGALLQPSSLGPALRRLATAGRGDEQHNPSRDSPPVAASSVLLASDDPDRRNLPDLIDVATGPEGLVTLTVSSLGGIALTGPGGDDVARAWIAAVLVRGGPHAADILLTPPARQRLFGALGDVPGVEVVADAEALLHRLETAVLARTRWLADAEVENAVAYRRARPYDPLPTLLAVTDSIPAASAGRWRATLAAGRRLALGALILDTSADTAATLDVDGQHAPSAASPPELADRLTGARLFALTAAEAAETLTAYAATEQRPASTDDDSPDDAADDDPGGDRPTNANSGDPSQPAPAVWPSTEPQTRPGPHHPPATVGESAHHESDRRSAGLPVAVWNSAEAPITVRLFGAYQLTVDGEPVSTGLRSIAKELLAWYLLRPDGAPVAAAVDALWPDTDPTKVHRQFWLAASNLRTRLRSPNHPDLKILIQCGEVYRPETDQISCDLWTFQATLAAAASAEEDTSAAPLRIAADAYRGDFLDHADYLWAEPVRADLHRRALDALLRLAELEDRLGRSGAALAALERAVALDGIAEEPYRRLMAAQARLGRRDAVRATWRALQRRLADIDVDPEPATLRLYRTLTDDQPPRPPRRPLIR